MRRANIFCRIFPAINLLPLLYTKGQNVPWKTNWKISYFLLLLPAISILFMYRQSIIADHANLQSVYLLLKHFTAPYHHINHFQGVERKGRRICFPEELYSAQKHIHSHWHKERAAEINFFWWHVLSTGINFKSAPPLTAYMSCAVIGIKIKGRNRGAALCLNRCTLRAAVFSLNLIKFKI
jgi:hypothetical protein